METVSDMVSKLSDLDIKPMVKDLELGRHSTRKNSKACVNCECKC